MMYPLRSLVRLNRNYGMGAYAKIGDLGVTLSQNKRLRQYLVLFETGETLVVDAAWLDFEASGEIASVDVAKVPGGGVRTTIVIDH